MSDAAPLLELEGVSKRFGPVQALDRVDFADSGIKKKQDRKAKKQGKSAECCQI